MKTKVDTTITVTGDRQAGKSYMSLAYAITEAYQGKRVLFQDFYFDGRARLADAEELTERLGMTGRLICRANGSLSISFPFHGGGFVDFRPTNRKPITKTYDLHIIDDDLDNKIEPLKNVERVIRNVCTNPYD